MRTARMYHFPLARSKVFMWAYKFRRILDAKGLDEATKYAADNIPKQFEHQVNCLLEGVYQ